MIKLFGNLFGFLAFAAFAVVIMRTADATDDKSGAERVLTVTTPGCPTREQVPPLLDSIARFGRVKAMLEAGRQCFFFWKGETVIEDDRYGEYEEIHSPYFSPDKTFWIMPSRSVEVIRQDATRNDEMVQEFASAGSAAIIIHGHSPTGVSLHSQEDPTATVYWVPKDTVGALN
jgi:hypothetical protein